LQEVHASCMGVVQEIGKSANLADFPTLK
jgi:hypothetical protein